LGGTYALILRLTSLDLMLGFHAVDGLSLVIFALRCVGLAGLCFGELDPYALGELNLPRFLGILASGIVGLFR